MKLIRRLVIVSLLLTPFSAQADNESRLRYAGDAGGIRLAGTENPKRRAVYIVQLRAPSTAEYHASLRSTTLVKPLLATERLRFDRNNSAMRGYAARLGAEQDRVLANAAPDADKIYSYRYGLNGFAARMTPGQAHKLESLPEVQRVWEDEIRPMATNFSPQFLGLFEAEVGLRGAPGLDGEGIVIGFIDSGVYPEHPALADTRVANRPRACRSSWAETSLLGRWLCRRFEKLPDQLQFDPPENWNGACESGEQFLESNCNNKLIGARYFIDGATASGPIDGGEIRSARDVDGHGTHTATTAAGNSVNASIFGTFIGRVQGIAPRARVAVYKACWLRPGNIRASCNTSDLAHAIDVAVADGVDIINYSIGSTLARITAPDDIALMAATKAGVLAVVAAGNEGPNFGTVGSPAGGPWVITAAASSRDGETSVEALQVTSPPSIAAKYAVREANFTPPLKDRDPVEGQLVLADDGDNTLAGGGTGTTSDACESLVNGDLIAGNIAFIQRGGCDFAVKIANAADAGAIAALVYNIAGDPIVMNGIAGLSDIPALMIGQADGNLIIDELDAGFDVAVVLDKSFFLTTSETGNIMGTFSARGPGPIPDILKPDVSAPGIKILAGFTPDAVNSTPGEEFAYISGTSMSTPHVAGIAALLMQEHPDWTPAALKSALMTTAHQDLFARGDENPAIPFDYGAGHIVPNDAVDPGLVYDVSNDEYDAFACGTESPAVLPARCDELGIAGFSFSGADMNQPSISVARMANERTVSRRVTNVGDQAETYIASVSAPPGILVSVNPSSISVAPGASVSYDVTLRFASGPLDLWRFGSLTWTSNDHSVRSTIAVNPVSLTAPAEITSFGGTGSVSFPVEFGYTGSYSPQVHGLTLPTVVDGFVDEDPSKTFTFRFGNGVTAHLIDVPADQLYLRFALLDALTDGEDDLDMYVYYCPDNINCTRIGLSGEPTSQERFDQFLPGAGRYAILIHGFATDNVAGGDGANYQLLAWAFGSVDDRGNMTATGPSFVNAGSTETVTVDWSNLASQTIYFGGISHNTPQGLSGLTLITIRN